MKKYLLLILSVYFLSVPNSFGQATFFTDYFDAYTAGEKLACQNQTDWRTWGNIPCGDEDALVTNAQFSSQSNSILLTQGMDLVKTIANFTTGNYSVVFKFYIPSGRSGYFNVLQLFSGDNSQWGFECYLESSGSARINAGGENAATFTYAQNEWHTIELKVNMIDTNDVGSFYFNGTNIHTWKWSLGADGGGSLKQLGGVNFYGASSDNEMYVDNFQLWDNTAPTSVEDYFNIPEDFVLHQNYPNPFNPSTSIIFGIPEAGNVNLSIYNTLGEEISVLMDEFKEAGSYIVTFNAHNLSTGTYIYKLKSGNSYITKKMLLVK